MIGSATVAGNTGFIGQSGSPFIYDTFVNDNNSGGSLTDLNNGTSAMANALTGGGLVWAGPGRTAADAVPPGIYAPDPWEPGASFSHLREDMYLSGNANALMTPNLNTGEAIHDPGPIVMGMFADMGWGIEGCAISAILAGAQSDCNPATNTYSQQVILIYDDAPAGLINVNGSLFTITGSPQIVSLNNLPSNGAPVDVTAYFTGDPDCSATQAMAFIAPESCAGGTCSLVSSTIGAQSPVIPSTGPTPRSSPSNLPSRRGWATSMSTARPSRSTTTWPTSPSPDSSPTANPSTSPSPSPRTTPAGLPSSMPGPPRDPCPCSVLLEVASVGPCDPSSGNHTVDFLLSVTNPPGSGLLDIGGTLFETPFRQRHLQRHGGRLCRRRMAASAARLLHRPALVHHGTGRHMGGPETPAPARATSTATASWACPTPSTSSPTSGAPEWAAPETWTATTSSGSPTSSNCSPPSANQLLIPRIERFLPRSVSGMRMPIKLASHFR